MNELAKHIEVLLLENDCVIVPGLGGFIAHYRSASVDKVTGKIYPPMRTIGFNPRLIMNDGLLVQSYMQAYNTDFPDATRKIEKVVASLKEEIYNQGHICLNNVGTLYYNINANYEFEPAQHGFFTPNLYGLESIFIPLLSSKKTTTRLIKETEYLTSPIPHHRRWIQYVATTAAAILLFFLFSVPVENTYIDDAEYASLGSAGFFEAIRNQSATSHITYNKDELEILQANPQKGTIKQIRNNINTLKPVSIKTERVAATSSIGEKKTVKTTPKKNVTSPIKTNATLSNNKPEKGTYIIVASLPNANSANKEIAKLKQKGYIHAQLIQSQGRYRIALAKYENQSDAYKEIQKLKKKKEFASAWIFTSK